MKKILTLLAVLLTVYPVFGENQLSEAEIPVPRYTGKEPQLEWWKKRLDWVERVAKNNGKTVRVVFLGDSITQLAENKPAWKELAYCNPLNVGFAGDKTQNTLWIVEKSTVFNHIKPKLIVLLTGTNNFGWTSKIPPKDTVKGIQRIVASLRKKQPQAKILVFGIFPRDKQPGTQFRKVGIEINGALGTIADGKDVFYENIGEKFLQKDGTLQESLFPDYLHPSDAGYRIWFDAVRPYIAKYADEPWENLVKNGKLSAPDTKGVPFGWNIAVQGGATVVYDAKGLKENGTVRFSSNGKNGKEKIWLRQPITSKVKPGMRCRLSFMARTENFKAKECLFVICTDGWSRQVGNVKLQGTPGWTRYSKIITVPDFKKDAVLAFFAFNFTGMVEVGDITLEPVD